MSGRIENFGRLVDLNFELRRRIVPIRASHARMVEVARACGASAHFSGSGGAITGVAQDERVFARLQSELGAIGCQVLRPSIDSGHEQKARDETSGKMNTK